MYVFMIFLTLLFTCILHTNTAVYVMAASIYKPKYWDKNKKILSGIKEAPLLHKTEISFFWVTRMNIDL